MPTIPLPPPGTPIPPAQIDPATGLPVVPPADPPSTPAAGPNYGNTANYLSNYLPPGYSGTFSDWLQQSHPDLYSAYQGNGVSLLNQFAGGLSGPTGTPGSVGYFQQLSDYVNSDAYKQALAGRDAFNMFQDQTPDAYGNVTHGNTYGLDPFGYTDQGGADALTLKAEWDAELARTGGATGSDFGFGTQAAAMDFLRQNGQDAFDAKVNPLLATNSAAMKRAQYLAQQLGLGDVGLPGQSTGGWSGYADDLAAQKAYQDALAANPNDKNLGSLKTAWDQAEAAFQGPRGQAFHAWDQAGQPGPFSAQDGSGWFQAPNASGNLATPPLMAPATAPNGDPWGQFTNWVTPNRTSAPTNGQLPTWGQPAPPGQTSFWHPPGTGYGN